MPTLLDTFAAAMRLGLARATLAKLRVVGGGPPFVKLGAKVMYREDDLHDWITDHERRLSTSDGRRPTDRAHTARRHSERYGAP